MKKSELQKLIREEVRKTIKEVEYQPSYAHMKPMETNKVPTAEQFFKTDYKGDIVEFAKEFAKLHVNAALQKASHQIDLNGVDDYDKIILNSYPENLIK